MEQQGRRNGYDRNIRAIIPKKGYYIETPTNTELEELIGAERADISSASGTT